MAPLCWRISLRGRKQCTPCSSPVSAIVALKLPIEICPFFGSNLSLSSKFWAHLCSDRQKGELSSYSARLFLEQAFQAPKLHVYHQRHVSPLLPVPKRTLLQWGHPALHLLPIWRMSCPKVLFSRLLPLYLAQNCINQTHLRLNRSERLACVQSSLIAWFTPSAPGLVATTIKSWGLWIESKLIVLLYALLKTASCLWQSHRRRFAACNDVAQLPKHEDWFSATDVFRDIVLRTFGGQKVIGPSKQNQPLSQSQQYWQISIIQVYSLYSITLKVEGGRLEGFTYCKRLSCSGRSMPNDIDVG